MTLEFLGKRTSFLFSPRASRQLDELKGRTRLSSYSDVLAAALTNLAETINVVSAGGHVFLKSRKTGKLWAYSPYVPPRDYPHFKPFWDASEEGKDKERRSFSFNDAMLDHVKTIQRGSRFQTLSDVVRAAIAVLNELLTAQEANDQILFRDKRGVSRPYILLGGGAADTGRSADVRKLFDDAVAPAAGARRKVRTAARVEAPAADVDQPKRAAK